MKYINNDKKLNQKLTNTLQLNKMTKNLSKAIFPLLFITCNLYFVSAAYSQWTKSIGGKNADYGQSITSDANGNVYIIGDFRGKADFDPGPDSFFLQSSCPCDESDPLKPDVFFAKYTKTGALLWARKIGGSGNDNSKSIGVDANGNVYITGTFELTADFDPSSSIYNVTSNGGLDIFLAKYNSNGKLVWANKIGGASFDFGNSLSVSSSGSVTLAGSFNGNVDFDVTAGNKFINAGSSSDPFFARYNTNGNLIWVKDIAGNGESAAQSIFVGTSGEIYITGNFFGTSDFNPGAGTFSLTGTDAKDAFYAKYDSKGTLLWADRIGSFGDQTGQSITADSAGNVYATGYFQGTVDFDPGAAIFNLSSPGFFNAYVLKLNNNGSFGWVKNIGSSQEDDIGFSVAVDAKQNVYATGYFGGTANFNSTTLTSTGSTDIYLARYNTAGKLLFVKQAGGNTDDWVSAVATDANGFVYLTGYYTGTATFFGASVTLTSVGNADVYISKFKPAKNTSEILPAETAYSYQKTTNDNFIAVDIFPNPVKDVIHVHVKNELAAQIIITDLTGKPLIKTYLQGTDQNINLSKLHTGIYLLQLFDKSNIIIGTRKIFKE